MSVIAIHKLKPVQAMAASFLFKHRKVMVMLPRQEGKTELGVRLIHSMMENVSYSSSMMIAKDTPSREKMAKEKFERLFSDSKYKVNTKGVTHKDKKNKAFTMLGSVDKEPDRLRGGTWSLKVWSEVAFAKLQGGETIPMFYEKVLAPTARQTNGYEYYESTPNGLNGWRDLWDNAASIGFKTLRVPMSLLAEMGLISREEYETLKKSFHPDVWQQEYEVDWVTFHGKAYPEYDHENQWAGVPGPDQWQLVVTGIDWGYHPSATCILFAYVKDGIIYVFDEHWAFYENADQSRDKLYRKLESYGVPSFHHVSTGDHEQDRNDALSSFGINVLKADKRSVFGSRMKIKIRLWNKTLIVDPIKCPHLHRELQTATWDDDKDGEIDYEQAPEGHFDAEAALRYLVEEFDKLEKRKPEDNPHELDELSARAYIEARLREQNKD